VKLTSSFAVALIIVLATADAEACSCVEQSAADRLSGSRDVVLVKVTSVSPATVKSGGIADELVPGQRIVVKVTKVWKGGLPVGKSITVSTVLDSGMCGRPTLPKETLLVYSTDDHTLSFDHCSVVSERLVPAHLEELDGILKRTSERPNKSLERTRAR
jgi:hypothetical protein